MGEWSKAVGEYGEKTVENFLKLIGWGELPKGISVDCIKPAKHSDDGKRQTHGIDFYFSYLSPLVDSTRKNVHISSKYTAAPYKKYPNAVFKEFAKDLSDAVSCFKNSQQKAGLDTVSKGYSYVEEEGVLFYLSNDPSSYDNLNKVIATAQVDLEPPLHALYVVDNKRISFITQTLNYATNRFRSADVNFAYPDTGKNVIPTTKQFYGKLLPVEYLNASVLPLRIQQNNEIGLMLCSIDPFAKEDLTQLIGLAEELNNSWASFIVIAFPDYDQLLHEGEVREVKLMFEKEELMSLISVASFSPSFKSLNE